MLGDAYDDALSPNGVTYQIKNNVWPFEVRLDFNRRGPRALTDYLDRQTYFYRQHGMTGAADAAAAGVETVREVWGYKQL